jgi:PIN domain nuclease of toxin-antitoxin system
LLLDTHVFLWWCADDPRLGEVEREAIRNGGNDVFLSAASVWEMVIKQILGRLKLPEPASAVVARLSRSASASASTRT